VNRHVYPPLLDGRVRGHVDRGYWNDLGNPAGYLRAHADLLRGRIARDRFPGADPLAGLRPGDAPGLWLGEGAVLEAGAVLRSPAAVGAGSHVAAGATVGPCAFVGRGCRVEAGARVEEAVLWDGTVLPEGEALLGAVAAGELRARG